MTNGIVLGVLILAFATTALQPIVAHAAKAEEQISTVREQWEAAWNTKDLETLIELYADDALLVFNGKHITGKDNIKNHLREINQFSSNLNLDAEPSKGMRDIGSLQYTFTRPASLRVGAGGSLRIGPGGSIRFGNISRQMQGSYSMELKREKGELRIGEHTWNETPVK